MNVKILFTVVINYGSITDNFSRIIILIILIKYIELNQTHQFPYFLH